ncbi:hypothetical protein [Sphingomonas sp.]|uniref:hypothetical protein n=1 Tax=Sphingomonas sp. TaxID=28214 RepID=UPI0025EEE515|nr:hypothetical protein [Sphingomonas sp.]
MARGDLTLPIEPTPMGRAYSDAVTAPQAGVATNTLRIATAWARPLRRPALPGHEPGVQQRDSIARTDFAVNAARFHNGTLTMFRSGSRDNFTQISRYSWLTSLHLRICSTFIRIAAHQLQRTFVVPVGAGTVRTRE